MLIDNVRSAGHTEWASLVVFEHKTNGGLRFCTDIQKLVVVVASDKISYIANEQVYRHSWNSQRITHSGLE